jgi:nucleotide-binding universal stress UspA family protein
MIRTILVPLDGSAFGEHALPAALSIARRVGARVNLLHVHRPLEDTYAEMTVFDKPLDETMRRHEHAYLDAVRGRVAAAFGGHLETTYAEGEVAPTIRAEAARLHADLIVLTTHARGPFARFWLGSVTDELLRSADVPLLLVHPRDHQADLAADVGFKHVLVPLDGSELAERVLERALAPGQAWQAEFVLLRVVTPVLPAAIPPDAGAFSGMAQQMMDQMQEVQVQFQKDATAYLEQVAGRIRARGLPASVCVAVEDQPAAAVLDAAQPPIDLIALATHGRGGLTRLLLGSTADKVIRGAHVPVLVQRPRE